jgi:thiosulfate dehydrogenase
MDTSEKNFHINSNMEPTEKKDQEISKVISKLLNLIILLLVVIAILTTALIFEFKIPKNLLTEEASPSPSYIETNYSAAAPEPEFWMPPSESNLDNEANKDLILYGKELIAHTSTFFGPNGSVKAGLTNGMNCQNCHLDAGTKVFGNNYSAVASTYPKYRARSGSSENMYKRINDCFERSLNGKAIDTTSKEMQAIVAYMNWLGKDVTKGDKPKGSGFQDIAFLDRAADPEKGKTVYTSKCQSCHQADGAGTLNPDQTAYIYPPLWGDHSYNSGAGLFRMSNFAKFVRSNMPLGASHNNTMLSDEEAWDVAAFVNSQKRPSKDLTGDWPKIEEKPFDHPFGPYADGFSEKQHKYGPFQQIKEKQAAMKKKTT